MPKGYRIIDRSPVFDGDVVITPSTGKPNLEMTAAEDLILRVILGGHGWKEGIRTTPVPKKTKKTGSTTADKNTERKEIKKKVVTTVAEEAVFLSTARFGSGARR